MKVLYSELKRYLPELEAEAKEVAQAFTLIGFMIDKFIEVDYHGKKDYFLDLEVRQNRADLFGVIGLARELSAYYNIPLVLEDVSEVSTQSDKTLDIEILATDRVKRVMAVEISSLEISDSPQWLKDYLELYEINSINNLVDITNYVMLQTAHASHVFDVDLIGERLVWEINPEHKKFTTLNGEGIELTEDTLLISDGKRPLSLSFIGGKEDAVNSNTRRVILEVAVYDGGLVRKNSRALRIMTEAGSRLEKYLDPDSIPYALNLLLKLIQEHCKGIVTSEIFDKYINITNKHPINVDLDKVQQIAGMEISYEDSRNYLTRLGFEIIQESGKDLVVLKPKDRLDIELEEDVFEEIIRLKGFDKIPNDTLSSLVVKEVTPSRVNLMDKLTNLAADNGYDEVRSWVLVDEKANDDSNYSGLSAIKVTNSINEEVPFLRQNLGVSLIGQLNENIKNNISPINLFEIGKVFSKFEGTYVEENTFAMIANDKSFNEFKLDLEKILRSLSLNEIVFIQIEKIPKAAHSLSTYSIHCHDQTIGIIYQSNKQYSEDFVLAEINLDKVDLILNEVQNKSTFEVNSKIVDLDINFEVPNTTNLEEFIINKIQNIKDNVWSYEVIDVYKLNDEKSRVTFKIKYVNLSDQLAKKLHETL